MKKCIYKITNLKNGKIYIGQTNDFNRRKRLHQNCMYGNCNKVLYNAIQKYGFENFKMEQIEDYVENYNEKELYWIKYYNSLVPNGYNVNLSTTASELNNVIDEHIFLSIIKDLLENILSYEEIASKYNFKSAQSIRNLNKGITYHHKDLKYPIRLPKNDAAQERAISVIKDLKNTDLKFRELAEKYECSIEFISNINLGTRCHQDNELYPIRLNTKKSQHFFEDQIDNIYNDIINTNLKWTELANKYHCNEKVFQHINQGKTHRRKNYIYPLRKGQSIKGSEKVPDIIKMLQTTDFSYAKIARLLNTNPTTVANINKGKSHKQLNLTYPIRK